MLTAEWRGASNVMDASVNFDQMSKTVSTSSVEKTDWMPTFQLGTGANRQHPKFHINV